MYRAVLFAAWSNFRYDLVHLLFNTVQMQMPTYTYLYEHMHAHPTYLCEHRRDMIYILGGLDAWFRFDGSDEQFSM